MNLICQSVTISHIPCMKTYCSQNITDLQNTQTANQSISKLSQIHSLKDGRVAMRSSSHEKFYGKCYLIYYGMAAGLDIIILPCHVFVGSVWRDERSIVTVDQSISVNISFICIILSFYMLFTLRYYFIIIILAVIIWVLGTYRGISTGK